MAALETKWLPAFLWSLLCALAFPTNPVGAQAGTTDLARPPATGSQTFLISAPGRRHGQLVRWTDRDGAYWARETLEQRGYDTDIELRTRLASDGSAIELLIRGTTPSGEISETVSGAEGARSYRAPIDAGDVAPGTFYAPYGGLYEPIFLLAETLLKLPGRTLPLAPSGRATLTRLGALELSNGHERRNLTLYSVDGLALGPTPVWFDGDRPFGIVDYYAVLPEGWEAQAPDLRRSQDEALAGRAAAMARTVAPRLSQTVVFQNVTIFDSESRVFRRNMTVAAADGRIVHVGPAGDYVTAPGSLVIDGAGKTLVPGLWDSHRHFQSATDGFLMLSVGITSIRDPGLFSPSDTIARKARIDSGGEIGPRITPYRRIDGIDIGQAPAHIRVTSAEQAIAAVREARAMGFAGVKLYSALDPALVPVISAEASRLGLHVAGHIPRTMRPLAALEAGYQEISHLSYVLWQVMPEEIVSGRQPLWRLARYVPDVDLADPQMRAFIAELGRRGTVIDPTLVTLESGYLPDLGETAPAYAPYAAIVPPTVARGFKGGPPPTATGVTRAMMRASFPRYLELLGRLHRAGIPIVAGTDGSGIELVRELELYVEAGMTPGEALAAATIVPARVYGASDRGAILPGRVSDLVLVDGDPSSRIGDLRYVAFVMQGDRLMRGADLRTAAGLSGMPE